MYLTGNVLVSAGSWVADIVGEELNMCVISMKLRITGLSPFSNKYVLFSKALHFIVQGTNSFHFLVIPIQNSWS